MLNTKLSFCLSLLYRWLQSQSYAHPTVSLSHLNFDNFIAWTGEFMEDKPNQKQVYLALSQLQTIGLITLDGDKILFNNYESPPQIQALPTDIVRSKAHKTWWWTMILAISFLGLGTVSMVLSPSISNVSQQVGHKTVINNPYQVLGESDY